MAHEDLGLGKLITEPRGRDAVHVAVAPVVAGGHLEPGDHVRLGADNSAEWCPCNSGAHRCAHTVGVVDPFLEDDALVGQRFWLFLYPGTISDLRHVWSHPAFRPKPPARQPDWTMAE